MKKRKLENARTHSESIARNGTVLHRDSAAVHASHGEAMTRGEMVLSVLGCLLLVALVGILLFWADAEQHAMRECRAFGYQDGFSTIRGDAICVKRTEVLLSDLQRGGNAVVGERKNGH